MKSMVRWMYYVLIVIGVACSVSCRAKDKRNYTVVNHTDRSYEMIFVPPCIPSVFGGINPPNVFILRLDPDDVFSVKKATSKQMKENRATNCSSRIYLRDPRTGEIHAARFDWWAEEKLKTPHLYIEKSESGADGGRFVFEGEFREVSAVDYKTGEHLELLRRFWDVEGGG